ncbi:hypothetical protein [Streptomyces megasporus]|uniref:hypothetical protein n=1 Tax=Streptomyces megasporus TaxID=44060 RepID=UPI001FE034D3|nr:hypothetical protein [Streptomyces megasporus]
MARTAHTGGGERHGGRRRPAGPGRARTRSITARRALRREAPSTVAVVADPAGFAAMRRYTTFAFDNHRTYLRQTEGLLRSLTARGVHTRVGLFDPDDYEHFCAQERIDPDTPDSRTRYVAEIAATGATVRYRGQPLDRLLPLLLEGWERQDAWERAMEALAELGPCADCGKDLGRAALEEATELLARLVDSAGPGTHHLVCSLDGRTGPLVAVAHLERAPHDDLRTARGAAAEESAFRTVLAAGIAGERPGGVVMRTTRDGREEVRGWSLRDGRLHPLTEAEVFSAYCTDARTGEPVPPEPGLVYSPGFPLPGPRTDEPHGEAPPHS